MTAVATSHSLADRRSDERRIAIWLLVCAAMVFAMAVIGAITRLTESGLSIVEWQPLIGALPPLTHAAWEEMFALYKQTPEYLYKNTGMTLEAFKNIFFWEWLHRLWGRTIGLVFALPFLWMLVRGQIPRYLVPRLFLFLALGGLQGVVGWWMVKSGLVDRPSVSHYRLATHLGLALFIYVLMLRQALMLLRPEGAGTASAAVGGLRRHARIALALICITIVWGAFVAGLDAGLAYNTFPDMDGHFLPPEAWSLAPAWLNAFDNTALVQFIHRYLALTTAASVIGLWWISRYGTLPRAARFALGAAALAVCAQVSMGIGTLLLQVPVGLASAHQAGAITVLSCLVWVLVELREPSRTDRLR